jgi:hypothetical protein
MSASVASATSSASNIDNALAIVEEMSFSEKLTFNAKLAVLLAKETKGAGVVAKAAKKEKKAKDPSAPKRKISLGTKAWQAFHKHCKETMPERFEDVKLEKEKLAISKAIKAEDSAAYDKFVAEFKAANATESDASSDEESVASPPPSAASHASPPASSGAVKKTAKEILAEKKAASAAKQVASAASGGAAPAPAKKVPKKLVKSAAAAKPAAKEVEVDEDGSLQVITVDGNKYHMDTNSKGLWKMGESGGFGAWVGYYQAETASIRFTETPDDE